MSHLFIWRVCYPLSVFNTAHLSWKYSRPDRQQEQGVNCPFKDFDND